MVEIFVTDSRERYDQSKYQDRVLYLEGFIAACSFSDSVRLDDFNASLVGLEDEACRLMLMQLDLDTQKIIDDRISFTANRFISRLPAVDRINSTLFKFHKHFVLKKYLFQLVMDKFLQAFSVPSAPLILELSEDHYLTQDLPFDIRSARYYPAAKNVYLKILAKQVYYLARRLFSPAPHFPKTQIAIFLYDIHNEFDLFRKFMELAKAQNKLAITIIVVDSGNPADKRVDTSMYEGGNVSVIHLYAQKVNLLHNYGSFYAACEKIDPRYRIFKGSRLCELEDIQYGFTHNVLSKLAPDVCLYANIQEFGRVVSNVCGSLNIPSICVEYAFAFDTYTMEKRIRFDLRACISEVTAQNWVKHKDPTPRREITGFCKIDDWQQKLDIRRRAESERPFANNNRTILFASTWAPNPNSPLLTEKVKIVRQLSEICRRHGWNLIIKKHPSEFDRLVDEVFSDHQYPDQRIYEHSEMTLFDCVYYADFVCTQNSSAFIETLYLNKPFSYITSEGQNIWAGLSYFSREKEVGTFSSVEEYEKYVAAHADDDGYKKLQADFMRLQSKFLYKTDGRASERLLDLASSFIK